LNDLAILGSDAFAMSEDNAIILFEISTQQEQTIIRIIHPTNTQRGETRTAKNFDRRFEPGGVAAEQSHQI